MTAALTRPDHPRHPDDHDQRTHRPPQDGFVPDPSGLMPLCDEPEFAAILDGMVANEAPRLFAVVQEYGERADGWVAAWGMAFADHAEVVSVEHGLRMSLQAPDNALPLFNVGSHMRARLVWFNPDAATPVEDDAAA